jgi:arylsulfatase
LAKAMGIESPKLWEGKKGQKSTQAGELDMKVRPFLDEMIVGKAADYIRRAAKGDKPFFTYIGLSNQHPPALAHPDFDQTDPSRLGLYADITAEMDYRLGQIVDSVDEAGIGDDTIIVFSSDNGPGLMDVTLMGGSSGPFRGGFFTPPWEGSMRVPAIARWSGRMPAGVVTEEMLSAHDWYKTFAALAGASDKTPSDRPMDGVDASAFLLGASEKTGRETLLFFGSDGSLMSSKWRSVKIVFRHSEGLDQPIVEPQFPMVFDLGSDPGERYNLFARKLDMGWMFGVAFQAVVEYRKSITEYPNIPTGADFKGYPKAS